MLKGIKNWLEIRFGLDDLADTYLHESTIPKNISIFSTLGAVALIGFIIQAISGMFLLIYYVPHPDHAFASVQYIMDKAPFGWLFRQVHIVGSNMIISVVVLHMLFVFFMGDYKRPRELTWVGGGLLLLLTLMFGLSGNLLPWSQLSYWSTTVVTSMPTAFPVVGEFVSKLLRAGEQITGTTLSRFFALHVAILPFFFVILMGLHYFFISRTGLAATPSSSSVEESRDWTTYTKKTYSQGFSYYPYYFSKQAIMVFVYFSVMFFIISFLPSLFLPAAATTPADPLQTPWLIRPAWYFLAPYQLLKLIPNKFIGISIQLIIVCVFLIFPFLERREEENIRKSLAMRGAFIFLLLAVLILMFWGKY